MDCHQALRILLLSDSHSNIDNFEKVLDWIKAENKSYDLVFLSGDLCNLPNKGEEKDFDQAQIEEETKLIRETVQRL